MHLVEPSTNLPSSSHSQDCFASLGEGRLVGARHQQQKDRAMEELERVENAMATYKTWGANALPAECGRLKVASASLNKAAYLAALRAALILSVTIEAGDVVRDPFQQGTSDRRTVDCVFRLLNVVVSDLHCEHLANMGDLASRAALDTGTTGSKSAMWCNITINYNDEDDESFNSLLHINPEFGSIDAAKFRHHVGAKLWSMWKDVTAKYREAFANFTKSDNHLPFEAFRGGRVDVFYLHLMSTITRPNLHKCVIRMLPDGIAADSMGIRTTGQVVGKSPQRRNGIQWFGYGMSLLTAPLLFNVMLRETCRRCS